MSLALLYFSLSCVTVRLVSHKLLSSDSAKPLNVIVSASPSPTVTAPQEDPLLTQQDDDREMVKSSAVAPTGDSPTLSHLNLSGAYTELVGKTPLVHLRKLSEHLCCDIYAKVAAML